MSDQRGADPNGWPAPPPRPAMSDSTPPPIRKPVERSGAITVSRFLWIASFVAGLMVVFFAFLSRNNQTERIQGVLRDLEPARAESTLESAANVVLWGSLGAVAVVLLVELILMFAMLKPRGWVRFVQIPMLAINVAVTLIAAGLIVGDDADGVYLAVLLGAQLLLAVAASVASFMPGTRAWFHRQDKPAA